MRITTCALVFSIVFAATEYAAAAPFLEAIETHRSEARRETHGMVVSPDGAHAYVAVDGGDTIAIFERDATSGDLIFLAFEEDAGDGVVLAFQGDVAISPDGAHLYVSDPNGNGVSALARDVGSGLLTLVEFEQDGVGGVAGLSFPRDLAVSPDGAHVYATGGASDALVVFARNVMTGALTFVEAKQNAVGGVTGLDNPLCLALSGDGQYVYVGGSGGLAIFSRNATTGALTFVHQVAPADAGGSPVDDVFDIELSPGGEHAYVQTDTRFFHFARNAGTGLLSFVSSSFTMGGLVTELNAAGDLFFLWASFNDLRVFSRDLVTGALTQVDTVDLGDRPRNELAVDPTGTVEVYATMSDTIVPIADAGGSFVLGDDVRAGGGIVGLWDAASVVVSPDGAHVYACGSRDDAIAIFSRDAGTGSLTPIGSVLEGVGGAEGLDGVRHLSISPDGATLYAAALDPFDVFNTEWTLSAYARDAGTGSLTFLETEADAGPSVISPDGAHVYVPEGVYERDPGTGTLTFLASTPLVFPFFPLAFSADGLYAYGPSFNPFEALQIYVRSPVSGNLTPFETESAGLGGVPEDFGVGRVIVSGDQSRVYVTDPDIEEGAAYVFDRDAGTGTLIFRSRAHDGPVDDLTEIPGGAMLAGAVDDAFNADDVAAFGLNPMKATLVPIQTPVTLTGSEEGQPFTAPALAVSPDGTTLYVTSADADALTAFRVNECTPAVTSTKVVLKQIAPEPIVGNDALVLKGVASLGGEAFASLDLEATGARVFVERTNGSVAADVAIPPGAYGGPGTAGWSLNAAGSVWTFLDKTASPPNGIKKIVVKDHAVKVPGYVKLKVASSPLGSYPVTSADLPVAVTLELGTPAPCTRTGFLASDCLFRATGSAVCKSK